MEHPATTGSDEPPADEPSRTLTLRGATVLGIGSMIGAGIFALLGEAGAVAGAGVWISFLIGGVVAGLLGYVCAKLGMTYPSSGGLITYLIKGFGVGRLVGVASWLGYIAAIVIVTAMVAVSFGGYATSLFVGQDASSAWNNLFITALLLVMLAVNLIGAKVVAAAQSAIVFVVLAVFAVFISVTLPNIDTDLLAFSGYPSFSKIIASVALTFFAYLGFNVITFTGGDLRNPRRDIPRATYLALGITGVVYVLIAIGVFGTLTVAEVIEYGETAIAEAARPTLGDAGFVIMAIVALLSTAGRDQRDPVRVVEPDQHARRRGTLPRVLRRQIAIRPEVRADHHDAARSGRREPRRSLVHRLGRQRRLDDRLRAGRRGRLPTPRRDREQHRDRPARHRGDGDRARILRRRHRSERSWKLHRDHRHHSRLSHPRRHLQARRGCPRGGAGYDPALEAGSATPCLTHE